MHVLISGSSGFLGHALIPRLLGAGHQVTQLLREGHKCPAQNRAVGVRAWAPEAGALDPRVFEDIDAVIHLSGASIGSVWTARRKAMIRSSRIDTTRLLAERIAEAPSGLRPSVLVQASAVGYYGDRGDEPLEESSPPGRGFLAELCLDWEAASRPAERAGVRVVRVRTGLVLSRSGGVLPVMLRPFRLGLGARLGSGRQWMPWIGLDDVIGVYLRALTDGSIHGAVNAVAPEAITNAEFTSALARAAHRPAFLSVPALAIALIPGGMGRETLLVSEHVVPQKLLDEGFEFETPTLERALAELRATAP